MAFLYEHKIDRRGNEYIEITGYEGAVKYLLVPDWIENLPVRSIGKNAFSAREDIVSVQLPHTIDTLGRYAFYNCKNLQKISLYDRVEDYYDGVIKQCQSLSEITLRLERGSFSVMRELLADNDRRMRFIIEPIGLRLTFPAYVYDFVEDVEARVLHHKIEGSGYPYRECVTRKSVDILAYDRLFPQVVSDDYVTAIGIAFDRLMYPVELETVSREQYERYLEKNAGVVLHQLVENGSVDEIEYMCEACLIPKEVLDDGLYEAAERKQSAIAATLMEYQRLHFGKQQNAGRMMLDEW